MRVKDDIKNRINDFANLCRSHKVKYLYAFGSSITDHFDSDSSDIDLIVELDASDPIERGEFLIDLWDKFELFFKRKVDLLTESSINNPVLRSNIDRTKILIYEGKEQKVFI
ncbi:nucleotidyltransferase family protein [Plebeiibacterium sediminum]|uniref:Nucleotidyltransferase domain-containing protein n=1 Tax=Plebeiibacterium sediminum TaxID=2992112 RepID=A0AAE3M5J8_9BACT|nr:nucleotidyltransferase domain-containing protein [Plebeiobacterium sediminum]MCW3787272.1 nucleotidyltransferase domain-containing protein [Plebeiobacterium sediminum]